MELDKRIKEGKTYLDCYDTEIAKKFIGKECYLSDGVASFANIDNLNKATLMKVDDRDMRPYKLETTRGHYGAWSPFILPCEWIKPEEPEKKYRAFTIKEFQQKYSVGSVLQIRQKQNRFNESFVQYVGYKVYEDRIYLGITDFTLDELFENFEMIESQSDTWQPFGVIDEDKE